MRKKVLEPKIWVQRAWFTRSNANGMNQRDAENQGETSLEPIFLLERHSSVNPWYIIFSLFTNAWKKVFGDYFPYYAKDSNELYDTSSIFQARMIENASAKFSKNCLFDFEINNSLPTNFFLRIYWWFSKPVNKIVEVLEDFPRGLNYRLRAMQLRNISVSQVLKRHLILPRKGSLKQNNEILKSLTVITQTPIMISKENDIKHSSCLLNLLKNGTHNVINLLTPFYPEIKKKIEKCFFIEKINERIDPVEMNYWTSRSEIGQISYLSYCRWVISEQFLKDYPWIVNHLTFLSNLKIPTSPNMPWQKGAGILKVI